jgi:O-acetyl-ADP-ribose deacetylase (regulator of RNase III)
MEKRYVTGNILESNCIALVNPVNVVGVMGKGLALQFKNKFLLNYEVYEFYCGRGEMNVGEILLVWEPNEQKFVINFPTKKHWRDPSKYEWIEEGLKDMVKKIEEYKITSVAIPALGCGNGGLEWDKVKPLIEKYLSPLTDVDIEIYLPN